jgi:TIR domain
VESVLIELRRLSASGRATTRVSLFGFTSFAELLHEGDMRDLEGFAVALRRLHPVNGTNIAAVLDRARMHAADVSTETAFHRILLVSDGLSNPVEARRAARDCAQARIAVDVILIDPIAEARDLAAAVADEAGGRWEPVFGTGELGRATAEARTGLEAQTQRLQETASQMQELATAVRAETAKREPVLFTATHPRVLVPGTWRPLYVHVLQDSLRDQLNDRLAQLAEGLGSHPQREEVSASSMIPAGTVLQIQPVFSAVRCRPRRQTIVWNKTLTEVSFQIQNLSSADADEACRGDVLIFAKDLLIAQIPMSFSVAGNYGSRTPELQTNSGQMISQVFGSYAHLDTDVVARFRAAYRALGIHLFIDALDIDGGEPWRRFLEEQIERSDLFQLFWSEAAAASKAVEGEWRHALKVEAKRPVGTRFIRPVFWTKPLPDPPKPLDEVQFWYFDLKNFGRQTKWRWRQWWGWDNTFRRRRAHTTQGPSRDAWL